MPDTRFYESLPPLSLAELGELCGAELADKSVGGRLISGVAPLAFAGASDVTFLADRRLLTQLRESAAGACFLDPRHANEAPGGCAVLTTAFSQAAWSKAAQRLYRPKPTAAGQPGLIEPGVSLGEGVVIGEGARIGRGTVVEPGAVIGPGVTIGRDCRIGARAVIGFSLIGDRVTIAAGAVIGEQGFGAAPSPAGMIDIPQLGRVVIQDGVTVGAGTCIDRGAFDDTVIGENTKIDNLVQIAHNVQLGRNCVLAAHTGISGSVKVGDGAMFGGRAGVADHVVIGERARIAAASGVMKDVPAGETWGGSPARPLRRWMRETAWLAMMAEKRGRDEA